jgi:hypothetical protein
MALVKSALAKCEYYSSDKIRSVEWMGDKCVQGSSWDTCSKKA